MQAPLSLRKPNNWQDFESLCKKLWGEIWQCPEIKKNGRNGQDQHGVDIYGIPVQETQYFGIQCKGKSEYYGKPFTEDEVNKEIEKAKNFKPQLKKLYFTTTAVKDAVIESFVRAKNIENIKAGLFEVHLFSWEDIAELIDENKNTHDWYVKSQNYKSDKNARVTFDNDSDEITLTALFKKRHTEYKMKIIPAPGFDNAIFGYSDFPSAEPGVLIVRAPGLLGSINKSFVPFRFKLLNTGLSPLDDFKILFTIDGDVKSLSNHQFDKKAYGKVADTYFPDVHIDNDLTSGQIIPVKKTLVSDDFFISDDIYLKPKPVSGRCIIYWKLLSKDFKSEGTLSVKVIADIKLEYNSVLISDPLKVRSESSEIEDFMSKSK